MDVETQQRNIDIQVCLRILKNRGNGIKAQKVKLKDHFVVVSSKYRQVGYYVIVGGLSNPLLSFDDIFQSFVDPERPTEEEFVMFKLQYGVDWIVGPENEFSRPD